MDGKFKILQVDRLCRKLPIAKDSMLESKSAFDMLNSSADPVKVKEWEEHFTLTHG